MAGRCVMNTAITFHGRLAGAMDEFVAFKRMQGYDYTDQPVRHGAAVHRRPRHRADPRPGLRRLPPPVPAQQNAAASFNTYVTTHSESKP